MGVANSRMWAMTTKQESYVMAEQNCNMNGLETLRKPIECQINACTGTFWSVQDFCGLGEKNALINATTQEV